MKRILREIRLARQEAAQAAASIQSAIEYNRQLLEGLLAALSGPQEEAAKWQEWSGGFMPIEPLDKVVVQYADGTEETGVARNFNWRKYADRRIVKWRKL